ncbi:hypothetical protein LMG31506_03021 [Cupriavidus yeoncheonensis]|uniref:Uncharacterized protein n=1 Tax=Cupriavidus yeoncheonensis TaxID=1462994 RepID=A0A916IUP9_9BURK|nr:hypothetical protein [Cupriavidus yeoncheonensis]CAG2144507.1 hypothetical protein LMG31506_03021 [Cupriavidus yeoncheonensis]
MNTANLPDGREVCTSSEEWRAYCEAKTVLSWPLAKRRGYLYGRPNEYGKPANGVMQKRGEAALRKLEDEIRLIWQQRQK